jgi:hypothetical protein
VIDSAAMKRLPLILSWISLLLSAFAVHVALHVRGEVQAQFHEMGRGGGPR